jgi:hypothetical protein
MAERTGKIRLTIRKSSGAGAISKENPKEVERKEAAQDSQKTQDKTPILVYVRWIEGSYCYIDENNRNIYDGSNRQIGVMINHRRIDWYSYEKIEQEAPAILEVVPV